jgi:hypothetical protein
LISAYYKYVSMKGMFRLILLVYLVALKRAAFCVSYASLILIPLPYL